MALLSYGNTTNQKPSILDAIILQGVHKTPFLEWFGRGSISAPKHSWILDRYRDAGANSQLEVTDIVENTTDTKYLKDNVVQIIKNDYGISNEEMQNAKYGTKEWAYRTAKVGKEHAKDIEYALLGLHNASVFDPYTVGTPTTPAKMAGIFHYIEPTHKQDYTVPPATAGGATGTTPFTYDILSEILQPMWEKGGLEDESFSLTVSPLLKKAINRFAGNQYFRQLKNEKKFDPTLYELETDFGTVKVKMHRLFADPKLQNTVLAGKLDEAKVMFKIATTFSEPPTSKTAKFGRYYTSATLEVKSPDYFACGTGLS